MHGDIERNREKAKYYSRIVYNRGYIPMCVQIYLEEATGMTEANGKRRELLRLGKEYLRRCDELWWFGNKISNGMKKEMILAEKLKIPVLHIDKI